MRYWTAALLLTVCSSLAVAAKWQTIAVVGDERVEIDKDRIMRMASGQTVAWTRLVLGRELKDSDGKTYTALQAMNRYDCDQRRFATLKRIYLAGGALEHKVREESIGSPKELAAENDVDRQMLNEACKLRTVGEAQKIAEKVAAISQSSSVDATRNAVDAAGVKTADMRLADKTTPAAQVLTVAESGKPAAPIDTPAKPIGERPRFIELPKIDKSQLESVSPAPAAKTTHTAESKGTESKAASDTKGAKEPEARKPVAAEKSEARPVPPAPAAAPAPIAARKDLERIYATSGPRRAPTHKRKPAVAETHEEVSKDSAKAHHDIHWSYEGEGAPGNWANLRGDFATCAIGHRQSPIDIRDGIKVDLEPLQFDYQRSQFRVTDNGHTIQVTVGEGSTLKVLDHSYQLLQFHFHRPSEERVNGKSFDMVIHLVHKDDEGKLAVVAVLLEKGAENSLIQTIWDHLPLEVGMDVTPTKAIDLKDLLPENRAYYTYMGSLTTPPCTEDVLWMVFKQPAPVSPEQIAIFSRLYKHNARPVQPLNNRLIKENR